MMCHQSWFGAKGSAVQMRRQNEQYFDCMNPHCESCDIYFEITANHFFHEVLWLPRMHHHTKPTWLQKAERFRRRTHRQIDMVSPACPPPPPICSVCAWREGGEHINNHHLTAHGVSIHEEWSALAFLQFLFRWWPIKVFVVNGLHKHILW